MEASKIELSNRLLYIVFSFSFCSIYYNITRSAISAHIWIVGIASMWLVNAPSSY
jgi:hypothetical protein